MYDKDSDGVLSKAELGGYLVSVDEDASVNDLEVSLNNLPIHKLRRSFFDTAPSMARL